MSSLYIGAAQRIGAEPGDKGRPVDPGLLPVFSAMRNKGFQFIIRQIIPIGVEVDENRFSLRLPGGLEIVVDIIGDSDRRLKRQVCLDGTPAVPPDRDAF